jgi:hypothetical protein
MGNQVLFPHMRNFPYGDRRMHMGIPVRAGIAKKFTYGDRWYTHDEIVHIQGLTWTSRLSLDMMPRVRRDVYA